MGAGPLNDHVQRWVEHNGSRLCECDVEVVQLWWRATEALARRHLDDYSRLAHDAEAQLYGPDQEAWFDRLQVEYENIAAALAWSICENAPEAGLRLAVALGFFWEERGHFHDGHEWFEKLMALNGDVPASVRAQVLRTAG